MANYYTENLYDIDKVKEALANDIEILTAELNAWKSVKRVTKKDGGDFANVERNFTTDNAANPVSIEYSVSLYRVRVHYHTRLEGYTCGTIYIYKDNFTASEIAEKIAEKIESISKQIAAKRRGYTKAEKQLTKAAAYLDKVRAILKDAENDGAKYKYRDFVIDYIAR